MDAEGLRKLQLAELELLIETDRVCEMLGLRYYLIGGTLLGAVRHQGFIPWDIDMDIAMPRNDYERFRDYWCHENSSRYFYQHFSTEKNHVESHAILKIIGTEIKMKMYDSSKYHTKHQGVYLDIFPLDYAPNDRRLQNKQKNRIKFLTRLSDMKAARDYGSGKIKYYVKRVLSALLRPITFFKIHQEMDRVMTKYNGVSNKYLVSMASHYSYDKQKMSYEIYGEPRKILFEGKMFSAPAKTEEYLEKLYGDYMKLPPETDRFRMMGIIKGVNYNINDKRQND